MTAMQQTERNMKKLLIYSIMIVGAAWLTAQAGDVKPLYEKECAKCHGADGKGETKMGKRLGVKDYTDSKVQAELKDDAACKAIKDGLKDKKTDKTLMKPFDTLKEDEIKALVEHMRSFKK